MPISLIIIISRIPKETRKYRSASGMDMRSNVEATEGVPSLAAHSRCSPTQQHRNVSFHACQLFFVLPGLAGIHRFECSFPFGESQPPLSARMAPRPQAAHETTGDAQGFPMEQSTCLEQHTR